MKKTKNRYRVWRYEEDYDSYSDYVDSFQNEGKYKGKSLHLSNYNFAFICKYHGYSIINIKDGYRIDSKKLICHKCVDNVVSPYIHQLKHIKCKIEVGFIMDKYKALMTRHYITKKFTSNIIDIKYFSEIILKECSYCGDKMQSSKKHGKLVFKTNGIDRIDSSKGYTLSNCQPCCLKCNSMKGTFSHEYFICRLKKIIDYI